MLRYPIRAQTGFTLVELMVASVILGMSITAVTTMLALGRRLESEDGLRRQARIIASRTLENPAYSCDQYPVIGPVPTTTVNLISGTGTVVPASVAINTPMASRNWANGDGPPGALVDVSFQIIRVSIGWTFADEPVTITLEKYIAKEQ